MTALLAVALVLAGPPFTTAQVQRSFRAQTGIPLVRVASASTPDVTTLTTRPQVTARFGHFELYVLRPATAQATLRALLGSTRPNARGIYWGRDQQGGWIPYTVRQPNLAVGWFPPGGKKRVDSRWERLQAVVRRLR
jgi:hypothetical protein